MGYLIAIEGIDGAGCTTQIELVYNYLIKRGYKVYKTKEPTNNVIGQIIHKALKKDYSFKDQTLALLFAADRHEHMRELENYLKKNYIVLMDRYVLSSIAYQGVSCSPDWIFTLNKYLPSADITVLIDLPPSIALHRIDKSRNSHELFEEVNILKKVRNNYLKYIKFMKNSLIIDGTLSIDDVFNKIVKHISLLIENY